MSEREIVSPNYPNNYPNDAQCVWLITIPLGNAVALNITDLDIEWSADCSKDYLKVDILKYLLLTFAN